MVLKNCRKNVNTGNTVRSGGRKRGHDREATIVKYIHNEPTSIYHRNATAPAETIDEDVNEGRLLGTRDSCIDDGNIRDSMPYSLNKKQRWNIGNIVRDRLILPREHYTNFTDASYDVTVIEQHEVPMHTGRSQIVSACTGLYSTRGERQTDQPLHTFRQKGVRTLYTTRRDRSSNGEQSYTIKTSRKGHPGNIRLSTEHSKMYFDGDQVLSQQEKTKKTMSAVREKRVAEKQGKKGHRDHHKKGTRHIEVVEQGRSRQDSHAEDGDDEEGERMKSSVDIRYRVFNPVPLTSSMTYRKQPSPEYGMSNKSKGRAGNRGTNRRHAAAWDEYYSVMEGEEDFMDEVEQWTVDDVMDERAQNEYITDGLMVDAMLENEEDEHEDEDEDEVNRLEREMLEAAMKESLMDVNGEEEPNIQTPTTYPESNIQQITATPCNKYTVTLSQNNVFTGFGLVCPSNFTNSTTHRRIRTDELRDSECDTKSRILISIDPPVAEGKYNSKAATNNASSQSGLERLQQQLHPKALPTTIFVPKDQATEEYFTQQFGTDYMPCGVFPPRFVINVTKELTRQLQERKSPLLSTETLDLEAYVIVDKLKEMGNRVKANISVTGRFIDVQTMKVDKLTSGKEYSLTDAVMWCTLYLSSQDANIFEAQHDPTRHQQQPRPLRAARCSKSAAQLCHLHHIERQLGTRVSIRQPERAFQELWGMGTAGDGEEKEKARDKRREKDMNSKEEDQDQDNHHHHHHHHKTGPAADDDQEKKDDNSSSSCTTTPTRENHAQEEHLLNHNNACISYPATPVTCNVCFEELTEGPVVAGEVVAWCLSRCGHFFCTACWRNHVLMQIHRANSNITCPEFGCDVSVERGCVLSVVGARLYRMYCAVVRQSVLSPARGVVYCPNSTCGRVHIIHNLVLGFGAACVCGEAVCAGCREAAHWPLSCDKAKQHLSKMRALGDLRYKDPGAPSYTAHVKKCPHCERLVEKNGGCPYMTCVCRKAFCWGCGKGSYEGNHTHCHKKRGDHQGTTKRVLRHVPSRERGMTYTLSRTELYERAVFHHHARSRQAVYSYRRQGVHLANRVMMKAFNTSSLPMSAATILERAQHRQEVEESVNTATNLLVQMHYLLDHCSVLQEGFTKAQRLSSGGKRIRELTGRTELMVLQLRELYDGETSTSKPGAEGMSRLNMYVQNSMKAVTDMVTVLKRL